MRKTTAKNTSEETNLRKPHRRKHVRKSGGKTEDIEGKRIGGHKSEEVKSFYPAAPRLP